MMPTAADYLWQFQRLLPRGRVWHRGWGTAQAEQLITLMPQWVRLHVTAAGLLGDAFPCSTVQLLPEWEATLGLPDPCVQPPNTMIQQRQAAVCAKFAARGGCSQQYFIDLAASLGYDITITTYAPFRAGVSRVGTPLYSSAWASAWMIEIIGAPDAITYFRAGISAVGERLADWTVSELQCLFEAIAPANTVPLFEYFETSIWDVGASVWDGGTSNWDRGVILP
jgi:uncharacterized protein YmfQ (DUF2313 family)